MIGSLTTFTSTGGHLAKMYELGSDGELVKTASANMTNGQYEVQTFGSIEEFAELVGGQNTHQAICASLPHDGSESGRVVAKGALPHNPGAVARTKEFFGLQPRPGFLFIDHDCASDQVALDRDALWALLLQVAPALADAGVVWRPSGSSHVCNGEEDLTGLRGQHLFALLADVRDAPRVVKTLAARMWLAGHGRIELSSSGSFLLRCPIDTAPADAARLIFAAGSECVAPLEQRRGPAVFLSRGGFLDSRALIPDLSRPEQDRYEALVESAKSAKLQEALAVRAQHKASAISKSVPAMLAAGVPAAEAEARISATVDAAYGGLLLGDYELTAVHVDGRHQVVTVAAVLQERERWHLQDCLVPGNEGHRGGSPDARLYLLGSSPICYSLDSGEVFRLRSQAEVVKTAKGSRGELVEALCRVLAEQSDVFATDAGPVRLIDGRLVPLTPQKLQNLIDNRVVLMARAANGKDAPYPLTREAADLVLAALN